ncbi:pentapeptide repeat-containing protein [Flagellimonas onchidii]|uniref:pentapeptide repeat-containing protein n=1 Tax=Flagellimonas onchidii TaxID=2562684 RepID=UPI0010A604FA|nr:pentapeptide repeat-containing protein [Allomuricauda onchidii]
MKSLRERITRLFGIHKTTYFFVFIFILMLFILTSIDLTWVNGGFGNQEFIENLIVELHGVLGDLLIFGIVLSIYDNYKNQKRDIEKQSEERRLKIERLEEEIDDYREWEEKEAMYRIRGNIRRLQKLNHHENDLKSCYLPYTEFSKFTFKNTWFYQSNLGRTIFDNCILDGSDFYGTNLRESYFTACSLIKTSFIGADLQGAKFLMCDLGETYLVGANLNSTTVSGDSKWIEKLDDQSQRHIHLNYITLNGKEYKSIKNLLNKKYAKDFDLNIFNGYVSENAIIFISSELYNISIKKSTD